MLGLEIEYLTGSAFAARSEDDPKVDWPPQPDRVFSALVATWGARGQSQCEREALEWLESQTAPRIIASEISDRIAPIVFVPPNDFQTSVSGFDVIPARRRRRGRRFPAGHLNDPVVHMVWNAKPDDAIRSSLDALARDTAYIGHSSSLTRCRFIEEHFDIENSQAARRITYAGRLRELERAYHNGDRPNPGHAVVPSFPAIVVPIRGCFSDRWIILQDDGGTVPDIRAAALVTRKVRDALMGAYERAHGSIPEWLSGHASDGSRSLSPHLAVLPLADFGWQHSEGRFMGCAIVLPRAVPDDSLNETVGDLLESRNDDGDSNIELHYGGKSPWYLRPAETPAKASLNPRRWVREAKLWSSATPIILDRYPKASDHDARRLEIVASISRSCENIGLPTPTYVAIETSPRVVGAPLAAVSRNAPEWQRWRLPTSLGGRYMTHATIGFDVPVGGPVIIGAGRYAGLGLCLPIDPVVR